MLTLFSLILVCLGIYAFIQECILFAKLLPTYNVRHYLAEKPDDRNAQIFIIGFFYQYSAFMTATIQAIACFVGISLLFLLTRSTEFFGVLLISTMLLGATILVWIVGWVMYQNMKEVLPDNIEEIIESDFKGK